ncbi:MAG: Na/Pi symporter [Candidatus Omnitrophica bacterium]|nr:Na/Pi symporter [Candidatus Omnitrophota bacterium]
MAGLGVTAILQSSSVTTGMVLGLAMANLISLRASIPLILGCNIGTCVTALIASVGTGVSAKRAALAHIMFNVLGTIIFLPFLGLFEKLVIYTSPNLARQIANAHTFFNVINTVIFLPFIKSFSILLTRMIKGEEEELEFQPKYLDRRLLNTPPIALDSAIKEIVRTLGLTQRMVSTAMNCFLNNDCKPLEKITRAEVAVDSLREAITNYLVQLMQQELSFEESKKIPALIHVINDVERIGDHAENLRDLAFQKIENYMPFSEIAVKELKEMYEEVDKMVSSAIRALEQIDVKQAQTVLEQECRINTLRDRLKKNHVKRLEQGICKVLSGVVFWI